MMKTGFNMIVIALFSFLFLQGAGRTVQMHTSLDIKPNGKNAEVKVVIEDRFVPNFGASWTATDELGGKKLVDKSLPGFVLDKGHDYKLLIYICSANKSSCLREEHEVKL